MEDIAAEDSCCCCEEEAANLVEDCCCMAADELEDASATRAVVLEDKELDVTAAVSFATADDFRTKDDDLCLVVDAASCCDVKLAKLESCMFLCSTTAVPPVTLLNDPFLSKEDEAA